jgi:hypothetical protein
MPSTTTVHLEVERDFVERQAKAAPLQALAEFVWNSLDADATKVDITLERNAIGLTSIVIRDNGTGFSWEDAPGLFGHLGGSWKRMRRTTVREGRMLHGREGRGRFKAMALGRVADWRVTYRDETNGALKCFLVTMLASELLQVRLTSDVPVASANTGVEVTISEPLHDFQSLQSDETVQNLAEIFAPYLANYRHVVISHQGLRIDPAAVILDSTSTNLSDVSFEGENYPARLEIIEWRRTTNRVLYLCNAHGFPLSQHNTRFHVGNYQFSAYLKSGFVERLHDESLLQLAEMNPALSAGVSEALDRIKDHFRERSAEAAKGVVDTWKAERSYPYSDEPQTALEEIERQRFDIVAVTASAHVPEFTTATPKARAWQLRMLRQAIERSPEDLQLIFSEVLKLPPQVQQEMADLLRETELSAVIGAGHVVADRLKMLAGLEAILFAPNIRPHLRERSQLHRIVPDNTWLFGEEFNLMVSDRSLTECLRAHAKATRSRLVIDAPVKHPTKVRGIVDLMLSKQRRLHRATDLEHLVVELKAPSVKIGRKELAQVEEYAQAVIADGRFDTANTRWRFWALSNDVDDEALEMRQIEGAPDGTVLHNRRLSIVVRRWGQVINENKARLQFFQEKLNHNIDRDAALRHLRERYNPILADTLSDAVLDEARADETGSAQADGGDAASP